MVNGRQTRNGLTMSHPIRWGILGAGAVARLFGQGLQYLPDATLTAVASQSHDRLQEFSSVCRVERRYTDYESLVNDPDVDIVYIATTNQLHCRHATLCLGAGKPVLCEKPFTITAAEGREVIELARRQHLFCMEAMWTRCLPLMRALPELLKSGSIGDIRMLQVSFGSLPPFDRTNRFFSPALGGGAMLDLGIYLVSLAFYVLGTPESVVSQASVGKTGVDEQSAALLSYPSGQIALISCSLVTRLPTEALIVGTRGNIRIHSPVHRPRELTLTIYPSSLAGNAARENGFRSVNPSRLLSSFAPLLVAVKNRLHGRSAGTIRYPFEGNGYNYEAEEAMHCLRSGKLESPIMPLNETLEIMETMDTIRRQWKCSALQEVV
jgi:predicted dehydrogenase